MTYRLTPKQRVVLTFIKNTNVPMPLAYVRNWLKGRCWRYPGCKLKPGNHDH